MTGREAPLFVLTVDAEEEWDWSTGLPQPPYSTQNILRIPDFQSRCAASGMIPTYFVDSAVLAIEENRQIFTNYYNRDECDIGAQLHPWCTAPVREPLTDYHSHSINLEESLVTEKIRTLTTQMTNTFGVHPFSFRCGRWGMNGAMLRELARLGYCVDSSVRPYYQTDHFSYRHTPNQPYWPSFDNICRESEQRQIMEIPVADGFSRSNFETLAHWHDQLDRTPFRNLHILGVLAKLNILKKIAMTPEVTSASDLCRCIDMHVQRGNPVITLFMHSSDLLPGATEYVPDEAGVERFLSTLETCARYARSVHGARFVGMREAHELLTSRVLSM